MIVIGVKNGLKGAISVMTAPDQVYEAFCMPTIETPLGKGKQIDVQKLSEFFFTDHFWWKECRVLIDGANTGSNFKAGKNTGLVEGVIHARGFPIEHIREQEWKKHHGLVGKPKEASRKLIFKKFPKANKVFTRKKDIVRAEAVLIALYGWSLLERAQLEIMNEGKLSK